ncbi:Serine/threonine protein kinase [Mycolicibacterium vaccae ATCC 25954]|uniref:Serine/threonine protein kinase n=1 Tax=Mycolicibacterium vaccae ATCC 25954 TaxID=1194972 RepID=K0UBG5_MYCVA|nr:Serine/threonine protein kinase [Mycolicibacterium vaccae ATCC 25954]
MLNPLNADGGGFGTLYEVTDAQHNIAVAKLVMKEPGAERELLIGAANEAAKHRNVVPLLDDGEHDNNWVMVMPRADRSLAQHLNDSGGSLSVEETLVVLTDIATALSDINGSLVHRDLKPQNVLLLNGTWSLADFGISRYAEASTSPDTRKYSLTAQYAAPEQWRLEHAGAAADVYAFGVVGYRLLAGHLPFPGPDFRTQHLGSAPPDLTVGSTRLRDLIEECLYKVPETRPTPTAILKRLGKIAGGAPASTGLEKLAQANRVQVQRRSAEDAQRSAEQEHQLWLQRLQETGASAFKRVMEELTEAISDYAPTANLLYGKGSSATSFDKQAAGKLFIADLNDAQLGLDIPAPSPSRADTLPFTVVSESVISLTLPGSQNGWRGRSHSLWFCDINEKDRFAWYELAFMQSTLGGGAGTHQIEPFGLSAPEAHEAFNPLRLASMQLAWGWDELDRSDLSEFVGRWLGWFGDAAQNQLQRPLMMPERPTQRRQNSWWSRLGGR